MDAPILGTEGDVVLKPHNSTRSLHAHGIVYAPQTILAFREWGRIPNETLRDTPPPDFEAQVRYDGALLRTRLAGSVNWSVAVGNRTTHNLDHGTSMHRFTINKFGYLASRLVRAAFFGAHPTIDGVERELALHAERRLEGQPSNDAAWNVSWGSRGENAADKTADGMTGDREGHAFPVYGRPYNAEQGVVDAEGCDDLSISLDHLLDDGFLWALFSSSAEACQQTGAATSSIAQALSGKKSRAKGWIFRWKTVERPAAEDMCRLDTLTRRPRFVTRDARLLVEKADLKGNTFLVEQSKKANNWSGYVAITTKSVVPEISGQTKLHRVVSWLFQQDAINAVLLANPGLAFADLHIDHKNRKRDDNRVANLEPMLAVDNQHAAHNRAVEEIDAAGTVLARWPSQMDAAAATGIPNDSISSCCRGRKKTAFDRSDPTVAFKRRRFQFADAI